MSKKQVVTQTRYEYIIGLGEDFIIGVHLGIIPSNMIVWKMIYEKYIEESQNKKPADAIKEITKEYKLKKRQVYNIIKSMQSY